MRGGAGGGRLRSDAPGVLLSILSANGTEAQQQLRSPHCAVRNEGQEAMAKTESKQACRGRDSTPLTCAVQPAQSGVGAGRLRPHSPELEGARALAVAMPAHMVVLRFAGMSLLITDTSAAEQMQATHVSLSQLPMGAKTSCTTRLRVGARWSPRTARKS